jgi:release factor glutamine methyltransferase
MSGALTRAAARPTSGGTANSVSALLASATAELTGAGCETARLDAQVLLAHALAVPRERLLLEPGLEPGGERVRAFRAAVRRRARDREPVAYITGRRPFRGLVIHVDRRVLIPRPETELLVEAAHELPPRARVLDIGTGSGAVALAVKEERPDLRVLGSDVSADALEVARGNATRLGRDVEFVQADLMDGLAHEFDAVLCNPPYVAERERASLAPEILRHEPPSALFAGDDGFAVITRLIDQLVARRDVSALALEIGAGQAHAALALLKAAGFSALRCVRDLAGIERVLLAARAR